jgi:hypothetical protein
MARYIDDDGNLTFDDETVARLTRMAEEIESDAVPLVCVSALSREELRAYLFGEPTAETLAKIRHVRFSDLKGGASAAGSSGSGTPEGEKP